jgi:SAM-dependent methyltransferase
VATTPAERAARLREQRDVAEGFGTNAERYDRSRPSYPAALIARIVAESPGRELLDVGCGTGIASRAFQRAGCRVLGLEPDPRMGDVARSSGVDVEVAKLEDWVPGARSFDIVTAAQAWHWIDPGAGARKAAALLRPGGRIALFWNAAELPAGLRRAFADVYSRVLPGHPLVEHYRRGQPAAEVYGAFLRPAADGLAAAGAFDEPQRWRYDWEHTYSRDEWLEQVPTQGGNNLVDPDRQAQLLRGLGDAVDAAGGSFDVSYATVVVTAVRR